MAGCEPGCEPGIGRCEDWGSCPSPRILRSFLRQAQDRFAPQDDVFLFFNSESENVHRIVTTNRLTLEQVPGFTIVGVNKRLREGLTSGELAREAGISSDTLRHYERVGVLSPPERTANGYRTYSPGAVQRVRVTRNALAVGFTLEELAGIFRQRDAGSPPCQRVHALAMDKLADIERRIEELTATRDEIRLVLEEWASDLARTPAGEPARLLERLGARVSRGSFAVLNSNSRKERKS
jgi:MerR family Zn(II)-responsive transcriptional regulator of zntA